MMHHTLVKTTTFNGVHHPAIAIFVILSSVQFDPMGALKIPAY
jgi:hypothetical protein